MSMRRARGWRLRRDIAPQDGGTIADTVADHSSLLFDHSEDAEYRVRNGLSHDR